MKSIATDVFLFAGGVAACVGMWLLSPWLAVGCVLVAVGLVLDRTAGDRR